MPCCSTPYCQEFDAEKAALDLSNYQKQGVKRNSRALLSLLVDLDLSGASLLDIGGGVGAITFELLKQGVDSATLIDISPHYVDAFEEEANKRGQQEQISAYCGDFLEQSATFPKHDVVVLDKVICCYPYFRPLVKAAADLSTQWIAYSLPRDVWWVRIGQWFDQKWRDLQGHHFPTYVHPTAQITQQLNRAGFRNLEVRRWREWEYALYEKEDPGVQIA